MSMEFYLTTLKLTLEQFLPDKPTLNRNDFKIATTAIFGRTPSDIEVDVIFQNNDQIPRIRIESIVRDYLVYLKRQRHLPAEVFSILDHDFKGYFDVDDLRKVWENTTKRLDWKMVLGCFRKLCPEEKITYYEFQMICKDFGLGDEFLVLGDGQM